MFVLRSRLTRFGLALALFASSGTLYGTTAYGQESTDVSEDASESVEGVAEDAVSDSDERSCRVIRVWCVTHQRYELIYIPC